METKECSFSGFKMNGFLALFLHLVVLTAVIIFGFLISVPTLILSVCLCLVWFIMFAGYMELEPNEARAMVFFGKYKGTFKETGFFWVNPFLNKKKLSLRARNLDVEPIKVNDKIGNPILIGLVLVWKLKDTYKAMFEIDSQTMAASAPTAGNANQVSLGNAVANRMNAFENFVMIQSDAALRQVAGQYLPVLDMCLTPNIRGQTRTFETLALGRWMSLMSLQQHPRLLISPQSQDKAVSISFRPGSSAH